MSPFGPSKTQLPYYVVDSCKGFFGHYTAVVISPSSEFGIQLFDEIGLCSAACFTEHFPDFFQEGMNILLSWFDQEFEFPPGGVFTHVLSKEVKAFCDEGDPG